MRPHVRQPSASALDLQQLCLEETAGSLALRPKSLEVLRYLVKHAGRVAGKEELMRAIWPDATVGDESLTQCISEVRRALRDENKEVIRTIPKRGYMIDDARLMHGAGAAAMCEAPPDAARPAVSSGSLPDESKSQVTASTALKGRRLMQGWSFRGRALAALGSVLAISAVAAIGVSPNRFAPSFEGAWHGGMTCDRLPFTAGPLVTHIAIGVSGGTASYSRPIYAPNGRTVMGAEEGAGPINPQGAINLTGGSTWEPANKRFAWKYSFASSYSGVIAGGKAELQGNQIFDIDGQQFTRPCSIKLTR